MGYREYFICSKNNKVSAEEIGKALLNKKEDIDIFCASTTQEKIKVDEVLFFGEGWKIDPINIDKNIRGVMIGTDMLTRKEMISCFSFSQKRNIEVYEVDAIVLSNEKSFIRTPGERYQQYFKDEKLSVNGNVYAIPLKEKYEEEEIEVQGKSR